ncbi:MAG: DUF6265 family protein [Woeseiaceae bacterium]
MIFKRVLLALILCYPILAVSNAQISAEVRQLHWLSGCWASAGGEAGSGEQWMRPAGGVMLGMNRLVHDGQTVAYEFLRIFENASGSLTYLAAPSGQKSNAFDLVSISATEVVFEDPDHDFPQRIMYRLDDPDNLLARIEGLSKGVPRSVDFPMTRATCDN